MFIGEPSIALTTRVVLGYDFVPMAMYLKTNMLRQTWTSLTQYKDNIILRNREVLSEQAVTDG